MTVPVPETSDPDGRVRLQVLIVTGDRLVYEGPADRVSVPGTGGMLTILPHHAALMAMLDPGELMVRCGDDRQRYAVGGGFLEVSDDRVTVLGDSVEPADEIDVARAEAARVRAQQMLRVMRGRPEATSGIQALRRSRARLKVAQHARHTAGPQ